MSTSPERNSGHARCSREVPYSDARGRRRTFTVFDHGAPFAVTRWTNLYFPVTWGGLRGDLVGGPLAGQFGRWVLDVPLRPVRGFSHNAYWKPTGGVRSGSGPVARSRRATRLAAGQAGDHVASLRLAIDPWSRPELLRLGRELPRWLHSE